MQTKLTLRVDDALIRKAKRYSRKSGKSVSRLVADYLSNIDAGRDVSGRELTPWVRSLVGAWTRGRARRVSEEDYRRHLEKKYR